MRPVDPRLLRYARSTRGFLALAVILGVAVAVLVIVQARLLATAIVEVAQGRADLATISGVLVALAAVFLARALVSWIAEAAAYRTAAKAKAELRAEAMAHVLRLGPLGPAGRDPGAVAALITRGVDALDAYFARYLPQLVLAIIVPLAVFATVLGQDLLSAVIIAVTLPIIPVFMILIGLYTRSRVDRQWETLSRLSGHFLDLVAGLPTLKVFGRAKRQAEAIRSMGERYRNTTMGVLRITFLSSFALELLASLSVALVAVTMGVRLVEGQVTFSVALFVLILAPEAYLPIRLVGQHFHAAAEGLGAADEVFALLEQEVPTGGDRVPPTRPTIHLDAVGVTYLGRDQPALAPTTADLPPGSLVALVGASGGGKSTLLSVLLGFISPTTGSVRLNDRSLSEIDLIAWRARLGWVPQQPHLISPQADARPTIGDAVRLGAPEADDARVEQALALAGVLTEVQLMPEGLRTAAADLSAGQARRVALARALLPDPEILLLDEPTASLDGASETAVVAALSAARDAGRTVIVVAHRPAVVDAADIVVHVRAPSRSDRTIDVVPSLKRTAVTARDF